MIDRDWLERICIAYNVYKEQMGGPNPSIEEFIQWLYKQYGIIPSTKLTAKK